jgi:hypothetical protein
VERGPGPERDLVHAAGGEDFEILGLLDKSGEVVEWWRAALGGGRHRQLLDDTPWDCLPIKD